MHRPTLHLQQHQLPTSVLARPPSALEHIPALFVMEDSGQQRAVPVAFAPPPPLWKHFTTENLEKFDKIKAEAAKDQNGQPIHNKKWTPAELRGLELSTTLPSLKDQGINQLYPDPTPDSADGSSQPSQPLNHAYYLLKISKSLLLNFLEFVGILSVSPEQYESKVEDMRNLFINAHHLLNLYRPHQSRESLITMMEQQLEKTKEEIKEMDKLKGDIEGMLSELVAEGGQAKLAEQSKEASADPAADAQAARIKDSRLLWDLLDAEV
ncbi:mediator of RNA polymerase II transcription subunit 7 [Penicillium chermesinum]|uniref:Mediator of RNA polymerase II transcription subunit 7 n=1 Tax=Penicillium chermesinum TaxID=63820 RepID=A0A9W9NPQ0_9EURO|nr:mediator of RNA polymerase II transcription subunit 7 [Penicillium chermesinum]KAJ5223887.1 mediator of RNA polymerase II transcription subunit 7 [Penicillium chermesinum]